MNTIRLGSVGPDVKTWQHVIGVTDSGTFDAATESATRAWQAQHGLDDDGVVGPMSWGKAGIPDAPVSVPVQGIDTSAMQGGAIPFAEEKRRGTSFMFARCHVGNNPVRDVQFEANVLKATDVGIYCGAYLFPFPLPHLDPIAQADLFLQSMVVKGHALGSDKGELPFAIDAEWPPPEDWQKRGCTADQIVDWLISCIGALIAKTGVLPLIYSYPYFLHALSSAKNFSSLTKMKLWIAGGSQYVNGDGHIPDLARERPPNVPGWGTDWLFWQHDGNGGRRLSSGVDADFNVFRLSYSELERLCQTPNAVPSAPPTEPDVSAILLDSTSMAVDWEVHTYRRERAEAIVTTGI